MRQSDSVFCGKKRCAQRPQKGIVNALCSVIFAGERAACRSLSGSSESPNTST